MDIILLIYLHKINEESGNGIHKIIDDIFLIFVPNVD